MFLELAPKEKLKEINWNHGCNEENLIKTLLDESGSEVQHNNLTSVEGFINSFTFENKEFRDSYESKEEKIQDFFSNRKTMESKFYCLLVLRATFPN